MKVPFSWLKELVDIDVTAQELEEKLFSCGFEVEELIPLDAGISKVVVGKIVEMEPQEGTHLTKCVVDCGEYGHDIRISTGAANMKLGDCVPAALDGSPLPGGIKIKARKMQGVESNGMLCSGEELGQTGKNFAAGMTGGVAYVLDENWDFYQRVNQQTVSLEPVEHKYDVAALKELIREHVEATGSPRGKEILDNFSEFLPKFKKVLPYDYDRMLRVIASVEERGLDGEQAQIEAFYAVQKKK